MIMVVKQDGEPRFLFVYIHAECKNDVTGKQMEDKSTRTDDNLLSASPAPLPCASSSSPTSASAVTEAAVAVMSNCDVNANKDRFLCAVCSVSDVIVCQEA